MLLISVWSDSFLFFLFFLSSICRSKSFFFHEHQDIVPYHEGLSIILQKEFWKFYRLTSLDAFCLFYSNFSPFSLYRKGRIHFPFFFFLTQILRGQTFLFIHFMYLHWTLSLKPLLRNCMHCPLPAVVIDFSSAIALSMLLEFHCLHFKEYPYLSNMFIQSLFLAILFKGTHPPMHIFLWQFFKRIWHV